MSSTQMLFLRLSAGLWVVWGLVHMLGGVLTMAQPAPDAFAGIAAAVDPAALQADYHPAVSAILNQHGWNLLWAGAATCIGAIFIWRANMTAIWVTAMIGGLFDIGYFVFVDLGGFGTFFPGTLMTIVSATAIALSGWVWVVHRDAQS
ncbi:MAG: hypothetical protein AAF661_06615 [Pseudomonadota bacterium]